MHTWVFYFIQSEDGEDRLHPNAFQITHKTNSDISLSLLKPKFPTAMLMTGFHVRYRYDAVKLKTFFWMDILNDTQVIPLVGGKVMLKLLRYNKVPKVMGMILRKRPLRNDTDKIQTRVNKNVAGNGIKEKKSASKTYEATDGSRKLDVEPKSKVVSPPQDFLSDAKVVQKVHKVANVVRSPVKQKAKFQDGGQTVGPVTLAEMEQVGVASNDGSKVYNASRVDKSTKSAAVRQAMEKREMEAGRKAEEATNELKIREEKLKAVEIGKQQAHAIIGPKLKAWAEDNGRKKNIRTLLSTMHNVMWENSKWQPASMAKLLNPAEVKKSYRKAMLVVHPDKNSGRSPEQVFIAERVFDAVNCAWEEFSRVEMQ